MNKIRFLLVILLIPFFAFSQDKEMEYGLSASFEAEKELMRNFSLSMEEELRLVTNRIGFDRSVTSVGLDYALWDKRIKIGAAYAFLYMYNDKNLWEPRHRAYLNLSFRENLGSFQLSWRGRLQGTYRDENRGMYKINPKLVLRNRFEMEYDIWGRPFKPYLSCELTSELNNPYGNELTRIRFQGGTSWRLNRTDYIYIYLRFDDYLAGDDANRLSLGFTFRTKF